MELTVYLAGQIHDHWREKIVEIAQDKELPLVFVGPQTNHERSDHIGEYSDGCQYGHNYE